MKSIFEDTSTNTKIRVEIESNMNVSMALVKNYCKEDATAIIKAKSISSNVLTSLRLSLAEYVVKSVHFANNKDYLFISITTSPSLATYAETSTREQESSDYRYKYEEPFLSKYFVELHNKDPPTYIIL